MLKSLTPNLMVEDVKQTVDWYRSVLGFEVDALVPDQEQPEFSITHRDQVQLMFQSIASLSADLPSLQGAKVGASQTFYIEVDNVAELRQQLDGKAQILKDLHDTFYGTREFYFTDCNGYILSFSQELASR